LARALEDARGDVQAAERRVATLQLQGAQDADRAAADGQLRSLQQQADVLEAELLALNPRYNQLVNAAAPAKALQQALRPDEAYLKILVLAGRSYGVLVTPTAIRPYAIGLGREQVNAAVSALRAPFEAQGGSVPAFDVAASARLFDELAGPVREDLLRTNHLIYEPDGALISLPVATLVTDPASAELMRARRRPRAPPDYRGVAWLGSRMASSLVLSGASFLQSRRFAASKAQHAYLGFGDPVLPRTEPRADASLVDLSGRRSAAAQAACGPTRTALLQIAPLPETAGEVRDIGDSLGAPEAVVLRESFNDAALKSRRDLGDFRVVYFATHALLPQPDACLPQPALITSLGGEGSDALLDASEIVDLDLDADLVVLAACDTGGAGAGRGEALGGLTRAMIYAGSRGLIVSHWAVDSGSAVRVMTRLFRSGAPSQAEGLRRAQAELQAQPVLSHPFFWAPFTVVGDGARPLPHG
jgi:CHAT domain-containing protein